VELTEAYRECERITWSQARNFAYGIRLLPPAKRRGLAAVYAFARRIDDIGDGTLPAEQKIAALEDSRRAVLDLAHQDPQDPVLLALADVERTFGVPIAAFGELIGPAYPDARTLCGLVARPAGQVPLLDPEPLYLRRPDAREPGPPKRVTPS